MNALTMNEMKTVGGGCDIRRFRTYSSPSSFSRSSAISHAPAYARTKRATFKVSF